MDCIPEELILHIFSFLSHKELGLLNSVNRKYKTISNDQSIWKNLVEINGWNYNIYHDVISKNILFNLESKQKSIQDSKTIYNHNKDENENENENEEPYESKESYIWKDRYRVLLRDKRLNEKRNKEKRDIQIIDTITIPENESWYIMDATWLTRWRGFAAGGPEPGPITNTRLLRSSDELKHFLGKAAHYRGVNVNVWNYFYAIYGGGPEIERKYTLNIYGKNGNCYTVDYKPPLSDKIKKNIINKVRVCLRDKEELPTLDN